MRMMTAVALIFVCNLHSAPKAKTPETEVTQNGGKSVMKDSKKESPGEDLYAAGGATFSKFVRMAGTVTSPKNIMKYSNTHADFDLPQAHAMSGMSIRSVR